MKLDRAHEEEKKEDHLLLQDPTHVSLFVTNILRYKITQKREIGAKLHHRDEKTMRILGFQVPCWRTMLITLNITTTIIILAAITTLIISINIIGPERQKPKTALINYSRPGDRGQQWQVPLPCIIDKLLLAHRYAIFLCSLDVEV